MANDTDPQPPQPGDLVLLEQPAGPIWARYIGPGWSVASLNGASNEGILIDPGIVLAIVSATWTRSARSASHQAPQPAAVRVFHWEPPAPVEKPPTYAQAKAAREAEQEEVNRIRQELFPDGAALSKEQRAVLKNRVRLELGIEIA